MKAKIIAVSVLINSFIYQYMYSDVYCLPRTGCMSAPYGYLPLNIALFISFVSVLVLLYLIMRKPKENKEEEVR